jgi:hypothetical protein
VRYYIKKEEEDSGLGDKFPGKKENPRKKNYRDPKCSIREVETKF